MIVRTLNANYSTPPYGLGGASTVYPVSAFITDIVYMKETQIPIDVKLITVSLFESRSDKRDPTSRQRMGVRCRQVEGGSRFTADIVKLAMRQVWSDDLTHLCS